MSEKNRSSASAPVKSPGSVQVTMSSRLVGELDITPIVQKVERTNAGETYHLSSGARVVGLPCSIERGFVLIFLQGLVILPQKLVQHNRNDNIMRLVRSFWVEHLIYDKLASPNLPPIISHYYSERLMKERFNRVELEVKLYGDAIAKGGLALSTIESGKLGQRDRHPGV